MVTGISADKFVELFPALYHMAESNTWSSMQIHGLLSTAAILDLFGIRGEQRTNLEGRNRPESTTIHHLEHGSATIRDQKPMSDSALKKGCLRCLLLVMCTYPFAKKALTLHLARGEGRERYLGCNLMQRKVLASSHQHLMTEAPYRWTE